MHMVFISAYFQCPNSGQVVKNHCHYCMKPVGPLRMYQAKTIFDAENQHQMDL